jgi:hypothetical protein
MICLLCSLEIESDSSVEEFEDALNADEDIFTEPPGTQNRLKLLSENFSFAFAKAHEHFLNFQSRTILRKRFWDVYSL